MALAEEDGSLNKGFHLRIHEGCLIAIAFLFPTFQKALPLLALILGGNSIVFLIRSPASVGSFFREKKGKGLFYSMLAFFLLHVVGVLYSSDLGNAFFDLQKKAGFFFLPLIMAFMPPLSSKNLGRILIAFLAGCLIAAMMGWIYAAYNWSLYDGGWVGYLYGKYFAYGIHRTYLAIYLLFGAYIAFRLFNDAERKAWSIQRGSYLFLSLFLLVAVFMTASRSALLALPLLLLIALSELMKGRVKKLLATYLLFLLAIVGSIFLFPRVQERLGRTVEKVEAIYTPSEKDSALSSKRLQVWNAAGDLLIRHFWLGLGTGDDQHALEEAYREKGNDEGGLHLDAHSQYLQTGITLGVSGLLLLFVMIFASAWIGFRRSGALAQLAVLLFVSALFESVLERQAGILFFSFFLPLLALRGSEEKEDRECLKK